MAQAELAMLQLSIDNDIVARAESLQRALQIVAEYRQRLIPLQEHTLQLMQQLNCMRIGTFEVDALSDGGQSDVPATEMNMAEMK